MKWIIATDNAHKLAEFQRILSPIGIEVLSKSEAGVTADVEETGETFEENALLKARAVHRLTGLPVIADDSGLEVYALDNKPGVYSARYGGEGLSDKARYELLLENMKDIPKERRGARFVCCIALVLENGSAHCFTGICEGSIGDAPMGEQGFGYDPVFMIGKESFAAISAEQKDKISHRGKAVAALLAYLESNRN